MGMYMYVLCGAVSVCPRYCSLCHNDTTCYECAQGYYLDPGDRTCHSESHFLTPTYPIPEDMVLFAGFEVMSIIGITLSTI